MSGGYGSNKLVETLGQANPLLKRLVKALYPPMPTLNIMKRHRIQSIQAHLFRFGATVVNVGSGGLSGCGYRLWQGGAATAAKVHHMDILPGDSVTLVGDAHRLPFQDNSIDSLIYQAVLEHVQDPRRVINEAARVSCRSARLSAIHIGRVARAYQGVHGNRCGSLCRPILHVGVDYPRWGEFVFRQPFSLRSKPVCRGVGTQSSQIS